MPNVLILALSDPMCKTRESCDEYLTSVFFHNFRPVESE